MFAVLTSCWAKAWWWSSTWSLVEECLGVHPMLSADLHTHARWIGRIWKMRIWMTAFLPCLVLLEYFIFIFHGAMEIGFLLRSFWQADAAWLAREFGGWFQKYHRRFVALYMWQHHPVKSLKLGLRCFAHLCSEVYHQVVTFRCPSGDQTCSFDDGYRGVAEEDRVFRSFSFFQHTQCRAIFLRWNPAVRDLVV